MAETDVDAAMLNNAVPPQGELEDRYSSRSSRKPEGLEILGTGEREWMGEAARWEGWERAWRGSMTLSHGMFQGGSS